VRPETDYSFPLIAQAMAERRSAWTADACLPGGDLFGVKPANRSVLEFGQYVQALQKKHEWLSPALVARYARTYGKRTEVLLAQRTRIDHMGEEIGPGLYEAEVDYLMRVEWARSAADILWRRTKLGLHLPADTKDKLDDWIKNHKKGMQHMSIAEGFQQM
jgi:glycerol-3-phosphate dehydrogenase